MMWHMSLWWCDQPARAQRARHHLLTLCTPSWIAASPRTWVPRGLVFFRFLYFDMHTVLVWRASSYLYIYLYCIYIYIYILYILYNIYIYIYVYIYVCMYVFVYFVFFILVLFQNFGLVLWKFVRCGNLCGVEICAVWHAHMLRCGACSCRVYAPLHT